jgi:urease accessory protein
VFHGMAHGSELAQGDAFATLAGMVAATALLHFAGLGLGHALLTRRRWQQVLGAGVAVVGGYSLLQWVV